MNRSELFRVLPDTLRGELLESFDSIVKNYRENRWEPAELNGGKLCEVVYAIIRGYADGIYPNHASKPRNMVGACRAMEQVTGVPHSVRIQIPRILPGLYDIRNNRGVGHVGGDVNPNEMDAVYVLYSAKWLLAELVRLLHGVTNDEAQKAVELIIERQSEDIWNIDGAMRVMNPKMSKKDQTLLLLYSVRTATEQQLVGWIEHSNASVYRRDILKPGHTKRLWEYNTITSNVTISPKGIEDVEKRIIRQ